MAKKPRVPKTPEQKHDDVVYRWVVFILIVIGGLFNCLMHFAQTKPPGPF